jgi:hypothetical protein
MKKVIIIAHDERNYQRLKALVKGLFPEVDVSSASNEWDKENNTIDNYLDADISNDLEIDHD